MADGRGVEGGHGDAGEVDEVNWGGLGMRLSLWF